MKCLISGSYLSRAYLPTTQIGQSGRQVVLPIPLPFFSQISVILMENNHDIWSCVKIIAVWFEKIFLIIYLLFITYIWKLQRSSLGEAFKRLWNFLAIWWNICLLPQSQVCHCRRRVEGNVISTDSLEHIADTVTEIHCPDVIAVLTCPDNWFQHFTLYSVWTHIWKI